MLKRWFGTRIISWEYGWMSRGKSKVFVFEDDIWICMMDVLLIALGKQRNVPNIKTLSGEQFLIFPIIKVCHDVAEVVIQRPVLIYFDGSIFKRYPIILTNLFQHGMVPRTICGVLCPYYNGDYTAYQPVSTFNLIETIIKVTKTKPFHRKSSPKMTWHCMILEGACCWKFIQTKQLGCLKLIWWIIWWVIRTSITFVIFIDIYDIRD